MKIKLKLKKKALQVAQNEFEVEKVRIIWKINVVLF